MSVCSLLCKATDTFSSSRSPAAVYFAKHCVLVQRLAMEPHGHSSNCVKVDVRELLWYTDKQGPRLIPAAGLHKVAPASRCPKSCCRRKGPVQAHRFCITRKPAASASLGQWRASKARRTRPCSTAVAEKQRTIQARQGALMGCPHTGITSCDTPEVDACAREQRATKHTGHRTREDKIQTGSFIPSELWHLHSKSV